MVVMEVMTVIMIRIMMVMISHCIFNKLSSIIGDMKETWKVISQLINKYSKATNTDLVHVDDQLLTDKFDISNAMNDYFCLVGKNLNRAFPFKHNPLLTNKYPINSSNSIFKFKTVNTR